MPGGNKDDHHEYPTPPLKPMPFAYGQNEKELGTRTYVRVPSGYIKSPEAKTPRQKVYCYLATLLYYNDNAPHLHLYKLSKLYLFYMCHVLSYKFLIIYQN